MSPNDADGLLRRSGLPSESGWIRRPDGRVPVAPRTAVTGRKARMVELSSMNNPGASIT